MNYKNITVAGSGVLGSQIAYQTSYKGFQVNVYDYHGYGSTFRRSRFDLLGYLCLFPIRISRAIKRSSRRLKSHVQGHIVRVAIVVFYKEKWAYIVRTS